MPDTQFHVRARPSVEDVCFRCGEVGETHSPKQWRTLGLKDAIRTCSASVVCRFVMSESVVWWERRKGGTQREEADIFYCCETDFGYPLTVDLYCWCQLTQLFTTLCAYTEKGEREKERGGENISKAQPE